MRKALLATGLFIVFAAASSVGLSAQQADSNNLARDLAAKNAADRANAYSLAAANGWPVRWTGADGGYVELQKIINGIPRYFSTLNANAAMTTRTDSVNALIGGSSGFVLRLWDGGKPRTTHREFGGRIIWADASAGTVAGHPTHTAGTLIASGVLAGAKGMSYAATIRAFEWNNDASEMASEAAAGANLSNHSYGYLAGWYDTGSGYQYWYGDTAVSEVEDYLFGFYDSEAQMYDNIVVTYPYYLPVVSAANDRDDAGPAAGTKHYYWDNRYSAWRLSTKTRNPDGTPLGYDCLPFGFQTAKNALVVGAADDVPSYTGPASVVLAAFSSTGPCDDGRIKPDLVGNGVAVLSTYYLSDSSYATASGTSMASPNVCGSLGLLADYHKDTHGGTAMLASTLKALVIHTALEAGANPGPDYLFGWGLLNTSGAYRLLNQDYLDNAKGRIEELTLTNGQTLEYWYRVAAGTPELRATISWTDPVGTPPSAAVDPSTRMLVNDLDLRVASSVATYFPWRLDRSNPSNAATQNDNNVDNVEQVVVSSPEAGVYAIRISHKGALGSAQKVSLVVSGGALNHVWHVYEDGSGDAATIGAAVSASVDGDSIYVHQGTYPEAGISVAKAIVIVGVDGAALTTVDGSALGASGFTFPAASKVILLRGFTIKNCSAALLGGGIHCSNSSVTVDRCVIENCHSPYYGGGMAVINASPAVMNCVFLGNSAAYDGGGIYLSSSTAAFDSCVIHGNTAVGAGGGIGLINGAPQFRNCTVNANTAGTNGGGVFIGASGNPTLARCLVTFNTSGGGIYGAAGAGATIACCDVHGNGVNYGGSIADRTGANDNISEDPLYCGPNDSPVDLAIATISPCAPPASPCGELIGALGAACEIGADLAIARVVWSETRPAFGDSVRAAVTVKNTGGVPAENFHVDCYVSSDTLPPPATVGDQRLLVDSLAAGDSLVWVTGYEKTAAVEAWTSWFRVDTDDSVAETDEGNNASGPHAIEWRFSAQPGWPVAAGYGFHSSPALVDIDGDAGNTLETVVGCDDGKLHVFASDGTELAGWPATIGDTLFSSPAVGDIAGDFYREIVIGGRDGKIYAFDYQGTKLWEYAAGAPVLTAPALADIDRDAKCEILFGAGASLFALDGDGSVRPGLWPVSAGTGSFSSPAVGDVDGDGVIEIAAIASKTPDTLSSLVYLLDATGTSRGAAWPAAVDTVVTADPVLGNVDGSTPELEIVAGASNGAVYLWDTGGTAWTPIPRAPGAIETSPALADLDGDGALEIVVTSRRNVYRDPPGGFVWETAVTAIDGDGTIMAGWPAIVQSSVADRGPSPSAVVIGTRGEAVEGNASGLLSSWRSDGSAPYGFPIDLAGEILASAAAGDIDGDGTIEIVAAAGDTARALYCYELVDGSYTAGSLWWPMFRCDFARTGCYGFVAPTGGDENPTPAPTVTSLGAIYPNPFNPATRVGFDVATRTRVEIAVYDVAGRRVATILSREMGPGRYTAIWDGRTATGASAASGVYFCRLVAGRVVEMKKMVLIR